jgi:hypothetical protein
MDEIALFREVECQDSIVCGIPVLGSTRGVYTPHTRIAPTQHTPLSLVGEDSNGTCRSCAFFRRGPFCLSCNVGALLEGRKERRRKRLKELADAINNLLCFFTEGDVRDRNFAYSEPEWLTFLDSPIGISLGEILGRDRIWALADWYLDVGGWSDFGCLTIGHLTSECESIQTLLDSFSLMVRLEWALCCQLCENMVYP